MSEAEVSFQTGSGKSVSFKAKPRKKVVEIPVETADVVDAPQPKKRARAQASAKAEKVEAAPSPAPEPASPALRPCRLS